jgi:hypothetical protein
MAFLKYAKAAVVTPFVTRQQWTNVRVAGESAKVDLPSNLVERAATLFDEPFDPKKYLLTHATIVASVDVFAPKGVKVGKVQEDGFRVNRKYADYRVKADCQKYINNNRDCWSRAVLAKSYKTFVGSHNFVEHVQIEDLSKGRIIDAVARDIGESIYVDILIATDRKHKDLVEAIQSGKMGTLSMGCFLPGTQVTMADGRRIAIEDVQPGDMVLTHKGRSREVLNKQIRGGKWDMRTIHAVGLASPITSTGNHPYYVLRPAEVCACGCGEALPVYAPAVKKPTTRSLTRRFKVGHDKRILNPNNTYSMDEFKRRKAQMNEIQNPDLVKVRADELRVGDFIAFPRVKDGEHTVPVSEGKARLLGYFLAEGSFNKRKGRRTTVVFSFSMEEKDTLVAEVVRLLEQEFPGKNKPWVQDRVKRNTCVVHLTSRKAADWFHKHGGEYSHGKCLSADAMNWSQENHKHLIGTWLNGDGHRAKAHGGFLVGTTVSLDLANQLHALMAKCGWFARFEARIGSKSITVAEAINGGVAVRDESTGRLPAFLLTIGNTQSVELQGYCAKAPATSKYGKQNNRVFDDWVISPITAIGESTYEGWVHDMEVDEDHTYVAEGASVSNCTVDGTICTKCGHWASDETEMCPHVKYEKGNTFYDKEGRKHIVAELCGHEDLDPTGGVKFIEASWVATPAFTGAVLRNVLEPTVEISRKAQKVLSSPPNQWDESARKKAAFSLDQKSLEGRVEARRRARLASIYAQDDGMSDPSEGGGEAAKAEPASPLKDIEDQLTQTLLDKVRKRVEDTIKDDTKPMGPPEASIATNESLSRVAHIPGMIRVYEQGLRKLARTATTDVELVDRIADYHKGIGLEVPVSVYRACLKVGAVGNYGSQQEFLSSCRKALGRNPTKVEAGVLIRLGKLLSHVG